MTATMLTRLLLIPSALVLLTGCIGLPAARPPAMPAAEGALPHAPALALRNVPTYRPTFWQKWNPKFWIGNLDEPVPPDWFRPDDPRRVGRYQRRNCGHNFTFYVMGIADKPFVRTGRYPDGVFNPHGGWNWAVCRYKWLRLPFISYQRGGFKFYIGWRNRGNFGTKLNF